VCVSALNCSVICLAPCRTLPFSVLSVLGPFAAEHWLSHGLALVSVSFAFGSLYMHIVYAMPVTEVFRNSCPPPHPFTLPNPVPVEHHTLYSRPLINVSSIYLTRHFGFFFVSWDGVRLSPLSTSATIWSNVPSPDDGWWVWSNRWNENWRRENRNTRRKNATLSLTNPTWPDPGSNPYRTLTVKCHVHCILLISLCMAFLGSCGLEILFSSEYLFFCPSMQHIHFLNSIKTCFGLTRLSSVVIEYSPPEVLALLCQFFSYVMLPAMC
jgi:hypothetical protein